MKGISPYKVSSLRWTTSSTEKPLMLNKSLDTRGHMRKNLEWSHGGRCVETKYIPTLRSRMLPMALTATRELHRGQHMVSPVRWSYRKNIYTSRSNKKTTRASTVVTSSHHRCIFQTLQASRVSTLQWQATLHRKSDTEIHQQRKSPNADVHSSSVVSHR